MTRKVSDYVLDRTFDGVNGASTYALTPQDKDVTFQDAAIKGFENSAKGVANSTRTVSNLKAVAGPSLISPSSLAPGVQLGAGEVGFAGVDTAVTHVEGSDD